jgi:hypothetical protein
VISKAELSRRANPYLKWILFTVGVTCSPIFFDYLIARVIGQSPTLMEVTKHGGLCLVSTALSAIALGDLMSGLVRSDDQSAMRIVAAFLAVVTIGTSIVVYTTVQVFERDPHFSQQHLSGLDISEIWRVSLAAFLASVVVGFYAAGGDELQATGSGS